MGNQYSALYNYYKMENYAALKNGKFKKVAFKIVFEKKGKQKKGLT